MTRYGSLVYDSTEFVTVQLKVTSEFFIMEPLIAYSCMFAAVNFCLKNIAKFHANKYEGSRTEGPDVSCSCVRQYNGKARKIWEGEGGL